MCGGGVGRKEESVLSHFALLSFAVHLQLLKKLNVKGKKVKGSGWAKFAKNFPYYQEIIRL